VSTNVTPDPFIALEMMNSAEYDIIIFCDELECLGAREFAQMCMFNECKASLILLTSSRCEDTKDYHHILVKPYPIEALRILIDSILHQTRKGAHGASCHPNYNDDVDVEDISVLSLPSEMGMRAFSGGSIFDEESLCEINVDEN
jgi:hypothetical protein